MAKQRTRTAGVSDAVLKALRKNANQEVHYDDLAADSGFTGLQVQGAISHLRRDNGINIESPRRGWYVYKPGGNSSVTIKAKAEVVALLEDEQVLLTIEGKLYVATQLEIN
jgi:biotin operon repressor